MTTKSKNRQNEFKTLTIEYVKLQGGEAEISDIIKYIQPRSRYGVERCSLGNILRSCEKLERRRSSSQSNYITTYALTQ